METFWGPECLPNPSWAGAFRTVYSNWSGGGGCGGSSPGSRCPSPLREIPVIFEGHTGGPRRKYRCLPRTYRWSSKEIRAAFDDEKLEYRCLLCTAMPPRDSLKGPPHCKRVSPRQAIAHADPPLAPLAARTSVGRVIQSMRKELQFYVARLGLSTSGSELDKKDAKMTLMFVAVAVCSKSCWWQLSSVTLPVCWGLFLRFLTCTWASQVQTRAVTVNKSRVPSRKIRPTMATARRWEGTAAQV